MGKRGKARVKEREKGGGKGLKSSKDGRGRLEDKG